MLKIKDSFFNLSNRSNSVRNNFETKNIINADNIFFAPERRVTPLELENIYMQNSWVNKCINMTQMELFKNGLNIMLPNKYSKKTDEFERAFIKNQKKNINKSVLDTLMYGGSLIIKRDEYQNPMGEYKFSKDTRLIHIPYTQYQGMPNFIDGTSIIDGASYWNVGTAGRVSNDFAISFENRSVPYSRQEMFKYQGMGAIESNLVLIKLCDTIMSSLANTTFRNGALTIKVKGNSDVMASSDRDKLVQFYANLQLINQGLNSTAMVNIDTSEDIVPISFDLSKYDEIMNTCVQFLIGLFGFSATSVLGASPKGFNSSGENEIKINANTIEQYQELFYQPILEIMQVEAYKFFGEEFEFDYEFNSPIITTRQEEAEIQSTEIDNAIKLQDIDSLESLEYLYKRDVIDGEEYDRLKKQLSELDDISEEEENENS